jgi:CheY-like chemotaxis protein
MQNRLVGRSIFPLKHVLVCEDNIRSVGLLAAHLADLFGGVGHVQVSFVSGAVQAAGLMSRVGVDLLILDHDMPFGNGPDLMAWLKETGHRPPIITFSGVPKNNDYMMSLGALYQFNKDEVIAGKADDILKQILGEKG